jgi:hypothetical protein
MGYFLTHCPPGNSAPVESLVNMGLGEHGRLMSPSLLPTSGDASVASKL